jgi:hypothetical protein
MSQIQDGRIQDQGLEFETSETLESKAFETHKSEASKTFESETSKFVALASETMEFRDQGFEFI